ncbi:MAG: 50S ribosomal protein L30 [Thiotrichales bacterium]
MTNQKSLKVTLCRSLNGRLRNHIACARGLGLRKLNSSSVVIDTPANRGMINKISYLVRVEEV